MRLVRMSRLMKQNILIRVLSKGAATDPQGAGDDDVDGDADDSIL